MVNPNAKKHCHSGYSSGKSLFGMMKHDTQVIGFWDWFECAECHTSLVVEFLVLQCVNLGSSHMGNVQIRNLPSSYLT